MKSHTGRKLGIVLMGVLTSALTLAQAGGAKEFGQNSVKEPSAQVQPLGGAKEFGQ